MADGIDLSEQFKIAKTTVTSSTKVAIWNNNNTVRYSFPNSYLKKNNGELYVIIKTVSEVFETAMGEIVNATLNDDIDYSPAGLLSIFLAPSIMPQGSSVKDLPTYNMREETLTTTKNYSYDSTTKEYTLIGSPKLSFTYGSTYTKYTTFIGLTVNSPIDGHTSIRMGRPE